ncbi:hypothetical protein KRX51_08480 [Corynebacterium sp. TAE3-ERU12]|uniref:hypothetical protein n=1 Tax=Corynebacterium sp. TAE3-ERU12 TaxID=2849491 RepID=UPI001C46D1FB|nr:hypothetical protein [Corynebacterium sp. TAE3-ERU12]MBV7295943.1 hypothetical protein [Corynebacterium sp. TAE3-ERU12]
MSLLQRHARFVRIGLAVASIIALLAAVFISGLGSVLVLAPGLFGICVLIATIVAALTITGQRGTVRTATLAARSIVGDIGLVPIQLAVGSFVTATVVLLTGINTGSADDMGRSGRAITAYCQPDQFGYASTTTATPWPGSWYAVPILIVLAVCAIVAVSAVLVVHRRPALPVELLDVDKALRRTAGRTITASATIAASGSAAPLAALMSFRYPDCAATNPLFVPMGAITIGLCGAWIWALFTLVEELKE